MSEVTPEVPIYRVLRRSYINLRILEEGEQVEYYGKPGSALEPINEAAKLAKDGAQFAVLATGERIELPDPLPPVTIAMPVPVVDPEAALQLLREEYEGLFGTKPHPATKEETLKTKIAEKRKELGFI
ncbi:hypothetical protein CH54_1406 [Yersinia rochesterensis]|uniref:Uncharacterized protein n=1 Tax=Yersinia rochesterensis TaxID=1604335 RepID=A0ABM5SKK5_9GAMM|nr:hypothetical protein [Yersinia rochesterensis]AIN19187.1 hypothetical protein DJ57_2253 [Yersinia rochesterensis]AJI87389.1 hypothetical protein AW19_258 [Yersinia frederiksenii Y225]AJJ34888.1 hypothetical protein CH54_1406 [Yersinia rochesterensis]